MSDAVIKVSTTATGTPLDAETVTGFAAPNSTHYRERIQVAGALAAEVAAVKATRPSTAAYGMVVRALAEFDRRFRPGVRTTKATSIASTGNNTVQTPSTGMRLVVHWVGMASSTGNTAETVVTVKFGSTGAAKYIWPMGAPGQFSHWEPIQGGLNESLVVNLTAAQTVRFNYTFEEST